MLGLARKWLIRLGLPVFLFLALTPAAAWAADDDEGASQIYAIYAAGQQGADKNNNGSEDINISNDKADDEPAGQPPGYEPTPGYAQEDKQEPGNAENNHPENNQPENNQPNNNEVDNTPENNDNNNANNSQTPPEINTDFPPLADSMQVLLWDAASQTNKKSQVTPVNLALRGSYLPSDVPALAVSGRTLVPVRLISEQMQASVGWDKATNTVTISQGAKTIVLTIGSSTALVDDRPVQVPGDVSVTLVTHEGTARTMVPVRFVVENLDAAVNYDSTQRIVNIVPPLAPVTDGEIEEPPVTEPEPEPIPPPGIDENGNLLRRVVLDAGHGGSDPGTNGSGLEEKDINLAVSLKLQTALQNAGFEVIMARSDDSYLGLVERAALTVQEDAPVFVSIHCNSAANIPSANGIETYAAPEDAEDAALAGYIQKELIAATGAKDRGVKTSALVVLTHNAAPACLVEIGFMSNSAECVRIADSAYQQKLADAVAAGVQAYFAARAEQNQAQNEAQNDV